MVYHPLSRLVPLLIQQRYDTNPAVRSTCSQKIYLLCLSGVEGLLSGAQKPLNDPVTNLQLKNGHPCRGASLPYRTGRTGRTAQETPGIRQGSPARLTIPSTNPAVIITSYPAVSRDEVPKAAEYSRDALYKRRSLLCDLIPSNAPPESLQVTLFFGDPQGVEGLGFAAIHRSPVCG